MEGGLAGFRFPEVGVVGGGLEVFEGAEGDFDAVGGWPAVDEEFAEVAVDVAGGDAEEFGGVAGTEPGVEGIVVGEAGFERPGSVGTEDQVGEGDELDGGHGFSLARTDTRTS